MKLIPLFSLFFITLLATSAGATYVTPDRISVTEYMNNYPLHNQNNSLQLACEIGQYASEQYGWNCDIRQLNFTKHAPVYINVFYPAADNKKGYEAYYGWFGPQKKEVIGFLGKDKKMYYRDWYNPGNECYISGLKSYGTVESYFGNVTENTDPVVIPEDNMTYKVIGGNTSNDNEYVEVNGSGNSTVYSEIGTEKTINGSINGSINTVQNQGLIKSIEQYWFDFKNASLSNVTFNLFGGN